MLPDAAASNLILTAVDAGVAGGPGFRLLLHSYRLHVAHGGARLVVVGAGLNEEQVDAVGEAGGAVWPVQDVFSDQDNKNRHFRLWEYLAGLDGHALAMTVDARDTVFQADPFSAPHWPRSESRTQVFLSAEQRTIRGCWWNTNETGKFLRQLRQPLRTDADWMIVNGGFAGGPLQQLTWYEFARVCVDARQGEYSDQGSAGWIGYLAARWPALAVVPQSWPWVAHLHWRQDGWCRIEGDVVVNDEGVPYACVHQYDRWPELNEQLMKKYGEL